MIISGQYFFGYEHHATGRKGEKTLRDIKEQYKKTRRLCRKMAKGSDAEDRKQWNAMGSHADFIVKWLETGRQPGSMRGIEQRSVYEKTDLVDPTDDKDPRLSYNPFEDPPGEKSEEERTIEREMVDAILSPLSSREREIYEMRHDRLMKRWEIAEELEVSLGTVSRHLTRAENKIQDLVSKNPLYIGGTFRSDSFYD